MGGLLGDYLGVTSDTNTIRIYYKFDGDSHAILHVLMNLLDLLTSGLFLKFRFNDYVEPYI